MLKRVKLISLASLLALGIAPSFAADPSDGRRAYQVCAACHMPTGAGLPRVYPSLSDRFGALADKPALRDYLIAVVDKGLSGPIEVSDVRYQGYMPPNGANLSDSQMADLFNYILTEFNGATLPDEWSPMSEKEAMEIRARVATLNNQAVLELRALALSDEEGPQGDE